MLPIVVRSSRRYFVELKIGRYCEQQLSLMPDELYLAVDLSSCFKRKCSILPRETISDFMFGSRDYQDTTVEEAIKGMPLTVRTMLMTPHVSKLMLQEVLCTSLKAKTTLQTRQIQEPRKARVQCIQKEEIRQLYDGQTIDVQRTKHKSTRPTTRKGPTTTMVSYIG